MKRAHELARTMEGDYRARMSLALRIVWEEKKVKKIEKKLENSSIVKLGNHESKILEYGVAYIHRKGTVELVPEKETEKAVYLRYSGYGAEIDFDTEEVVEVFEEKYVTKAAWLPKSQIFVGDSHIEVPRWIAKRSEIFSFAAEK